MGYERVLKIQKAKPMQEAKSSFITYHLLKFQASEGPKTTVLTILYQHNWHKRTSNFFCVERSIEPNLKIDVF